MGSERWGRASMTRVQRIVRREALVWDAFFFLSLGWIIFGALPFIGILVLGLVFGNYPIEGQPIPEGWPAYTPPWWAMYPLVAFLVVVTVFSTPLPLRGFRSLRFYLLVSATFIASVTLLSGAMALIRDHTFWGLDWLVLIPVLCGVAIVVRMIAGWMRLVPRAWREYLDDDGTVIEPRDVVRDTPPRPWHGIDGVVRRRGLSAQAAPPPDRPAHREDPPSGLFIDYDAHRWLFVPNEFPWNEYDDAQAWADAVVDVFTRGPRRKRPRPELLDWLRAYLPGAVHNNTSGAARFLHLPTLQAPLMMVDIGESPTDESYAYSDLTGQDDPDQMSAPDVSTFISPHLGDGVKAMRMVTGSSGTITRATNWVWRTDGRDIVMLTGTTDLAVGEAMDPVLDDLARSIRLP